MALISYSTLVNGSSVLFNPLTDVLFFDLPTISAADLMFTPFGTNSVTVSVPGRGFTLVGVTQADFTSANLVLANGSQLVQGSTVNQHADVLTGRAGNDLLFGGPADRTISLVSADIAGVQGNAGSANPSLSADGRFVAFHSAANLVVGQANFTHDVFVKDVQTGLLTLISTDSRGLESNSTSAMASLSADGQRVAFQSAATNLVAGDTNIVEDIFVKDLETGVMTRVSTDSAGVQANAFSVLPALSGDGAFVAFQSSATNLVAGGDTNASTDVFVKNLQTGAVSRASTSSLGAQADGASSEVSLSFDGRFASFQSVATNLVGADTNGQSDVFVKDLMFGSIARVSVGLAGVQGNLASGNASISANGRYVAFESEATNLVTGDTNGFQDVFVRDRLLNVTTRVSTAGDGTQANSSSFDAALSADGRHLVFRSFATNLVAGTPSGVLSTFTKDLLTGAVALMSSSADGEPGPQSSVTPAISADGHTVAFASASPNLVDGDLFVGLDVFATVNPLRVTTMTGGLGHDVYVIANTRDLIVEAVGGGTDSVRASVSYTLGANLENLVLIGDGSIDATGNTLNNLLTGNAGDNVFDGGAGVDTVSYAVASGSVGIDLGLAGPQDTDVAGVDTLIGVENLTGSAFDDVLIGDSAANVLDGGAGADILAGGLGDDTYVLNTALDTVYEYAGEGTDTVRASFSMTLGADLENLALMGSGNLNAVGNAGNNVLSGNAGNNVLNGGAGTDTASYAAARNGVTVGLDRSGLQGTGAGIDTLIGIENLSGSGFVDTLHGNAGNNVLNGGNGVDTVTYARAAAGVNVNLALTTAQATLGAGADTLLNVENLTGSAFADTLTGNAGVNTLDGGLGADTLIGGAGNDIYRVDAVTDVVTELAAGGTDTVITGVSLTLAAEVENLTLAGSANLAGTGNALANVLTGNAGANLLDGGAGSDTASYAGATSAVNVDLAAGTATGGGGIDTLVAIESVLGSAFSDTLAGNAAANTLNGGLGADTLIGGDGSDNYTVDDVGDVVSETNAAVAGGSDSVNSSLATYTLGANIENGRLLSAAAANLVGNALGNTLIAGAGDNTLDGGAGVDTVSYTGATAAVVVALARLGAQATVGSGQDTLIGIENLTGSNFDDQISGNADANLLNGGAGNDLLTGGVGADLFRFANSLGTSNVDTIADFLVVDDTIQLENAVFTALVVAGTLGAANFVGGAGVTTALDINDFVLYDSSTGALRYDADGSGAASAAVHFGTVLTGLLLTSADFVVT